MTTESSLQKEKLQTLEDNSEKLKTGKFAIQGKEVTVTESEDNIIVENIPVQALSQDRDGDKITNEGQQKVVTQLQSGQVPAFPNHGIGEYDAIYDFRDIMGQWIDGKHEDGKTFGTLRLRKGNEAAEHLKDLLEQDMPVGFSVGFIPLDFDEKQDSGAMEINDLDLMEVSPVGIPSNPEAVNELGDTPVAMAKSIMKESKKKNHDAEEFSQKFAEKLKNAMTENIEQNKDKKASQEKGENQETKNELTLDTKQVSPDEVDDVMEIINIHNETMKEDIRIYMEENDLIEEEETDEAEETSGEHDEEESDESDYDDDKDDEDKASKDEKESSEHNEDSQKGESAESEQENKETGLEDFESTASKNKGSSNKIDQLDENQDKNLSEEKDQSMDPFKITPDSKA